MLDPVRRRLTAVLSLLLTALLLAGCAMPSLPAVPTFGEEGVRVRVTSVPV